MPLSQAPTLTKQRLTAKFLHLHGPAGDISLFCSDPEELSYQLWVERKKGKTQRVLNLDLEV
jgi:hypothetical protein